MKIQTCLWILIILTANQSRRLLSNVCGCQKEIGGGGYIFYFHLHTIVYNLHDTCIIIHLRGIFMNIFAKDFKLHLLQYGPPLFLKIGVHFCSPQREKDTPESLVSPRRQHSISRTLGKKTMVARQLAVWQARVRFSARHHRKVFPTEHKSDEEIERGPSEWRRINELYKCDKMNVCMLKKI
jgi:hypothetical protein